MWKGIVEWLEVRIGLKDFLREQFTEYRVPPDINIFYTLGIVAFFAYIIQAVTGFFLLLYYIPHSEHAFQSVQHIMTEVPYGWLIRLMHVVGSNLMVAVVFLHLISVFIMNSYKKPRELTWVVGGLLLLTTLTFCLSGYLLPWSQLSFWATTIVTNLPTAFPYLGDWLAYLLKGSEQVSGTTLNRFFALHVAFLPPILVTLFGLHLFLVRRIGISRPPFSKNYPPPSSWTQYRHEEYPEGIPFYPSFFIKEMYMVVLYMVIMFFVITFMPTLFLPEEASIPADPYTTPLHIKPEWYFLAPYQMLKLIPNKFLGISIQLVLLFIFLFWPFFDTSDERDIRKRPLLLTVFFLTIGVWIILTIWGKYS